MGVEYGVRVEYDGSVEYDVVVVCTKRTKDKEKHYLKTSARESHIVPLHNRLGLTTHGLIEISDLRETFMLFCEFTKTTTIPS